MLAMKLNDFLFVFVSLVMTTLLPLQAQAVDDKIKIGLITTLSGCGSALGVDVRDGFQLAMDLQGGKLGGVPVELIVSDDARKVGKAKQIAARMMQRDRVDIMTGIIWSNLALAVVPSVTRSGIFYISPNAGPSRLAGKECHKNYFNVAWQNDNLSEAAGKLLSDRGLKSVYVLAPNYPAGKDMIAGFKRFYKTPLAGEVYTKLGQMDYAAEIANLRAAKPDAVYFFLPGGMGINFVKQYAQAGLQGKIPMFGPVFSFDEGILNSVGDAAVGVLNTSHWNKELDNVANREFVAAYRKKHGKLPSFYVSQGYDAARLIASAIKAVGGDMSKKDAFRNALEAAKFASVRGKFRFGHNHHPIQDIYVQEVYKAGGNYTNRLLGKVLTDHSDAYASECKM
jgi:branched-chain amino acid transport system substrate-binding protein